MTLPIDFQFSQHNLQDFLDCPRRFQLRYLLRQDWPAVQTEPVIEQERLMAQGQRFHRLVQQHQSGIPVDLLNSQMEDPELQEWWAHYLASGPQDLPPLRRVEYTLTAPFEGLRLLAKYDLVAVDPGQRWLILDWKTSRSRPKRQNLKNRVQTRLYPLLAVLAGQTLNQHQPVQPDQVEMTYWFPCFPDQPETFHYTQSAYEQDREFVTKTIQQVLAMDFAGQFPLTPLERSCSFCNYRSLCQRGDQAGNFQDQADSDLGELPESFLDDLDQVGEIQF